MAARRVRVCALGLPALLLLLLLLLPRRAAGHGGKYSREKNEPGPEFRMEKLNQLWEKARRLSLSPVKLAELHSDLKIQERDELSWKKLKVEGLDEDGQKEAQLVHSLNVILARYGLDGRQDAQAVRSNALEDSTLDEGLDDPRLEKLWHKAKTSGKFSREELDRLWREFLHHKDKVQEYNLLLGTLGQTEELQDNVIGAAEPSPVPSESRHQELKNRMRSINQGLDRLRRVSQQGYGADGQAEFEEPRVLELWDLAQSANLSQKELDSLREELKHFEVKLEKHSHYQKQLALSHEKLRHVERLGDQEHLRRNQEKHAQLEERTKELGYKVKKHLQDLSSRISRARHNEL
ncbi:alpha-2-macroglobulin receptor-associated protein [Ochotona curzoniae]|uniref:alpha-2-macroglobulin receptor-associated protein n=1 Tax=Ochotona curzoniae TaxID=130825 RepID=UPI001B34CE94|nr:alpha-2-macroglobulin receptor-associated protein [Ochotona curzoniae]XP_040822145.1 alpha-2-macroglobulin receptor-associated protein [Ochotona curzoniae]